MTLLQPFAVIPSLGLTCALGCARDESRIVRDYSDAHATDWSILPTNYAPIDAGMARKDCSKAKTFINTEIEQPDEFFELGHVDLPVPCPHGTTFKCAMFVSSDRKRSRLGAVCVGTRETCGWRHGWDCSL